MLNQQQQHKDSTDRYGWLNAVFPALPCAQTHWGCRDTKRFHVPTCLFCRWRREEAGKWFKPKQYYSYVYLSMPYTWAPLIQKDTQMQVGWAQVPTTLLIDPRGHFTQLRCSAIMFVDRLMVKLKLWGNHRAANICEFLANYPTW
jgi:hypothetical protein